MSKTIIKIISKMKDNNILKTISKTLKNNKMNVNLEERILKFIKKDIHKISEGNVISEYKNKEYLKSFLQKINPVNITLGLQEQVENFISRDGNQVVLSQSRFWASAITWTLMGGSTFALVWLSIAKTDEIVIAPGRLEPKGGVINVQMPLEGVAKEILIKEGERVKKDQLLIRLDTDLTDSRNKSLQNILELKIKKLEKLLYLSKEGAVSEFQVIQQQEEIEDLKSQIKSNLVRLKYQEIISPVDGIVFDLQPKGPGYVARTSQPVLQIVPLNNLQAKVEIDSRTIGFVKTGKAVEISIDSFPATDFGVIEGKVIRLGSDALPPNPAEGKGYRFPATVQLDSQSLLLKSGEELKLQTGMSLIANIKLRKVTYLQLFFSKFSNKANSLKSI